jgi:hypothetical protein
MSRYETQGGLPTPGLIYKRISENLRLVQEDCAMMSHFYATEDQLKDQQLSRGWLTMSELFKQIQHKIIMMEVGRAQ